jgi:hypothetical protein
MVGHDRAWERFSVQTPAGATDNSFGELDPNHLSGYAAQTHRW